MDIKLLTEARDIYQPRRQVPLLYLAREPGSDAGGDKAIYKNNTGPFYVFIIVILFACLGILLNIGLRIQNVNYQKEIYDINSMIALEEERADRLNLEIAELRSPSRIIAVAENDLNMELSDEYQIIKVSSSGLANNEKIFDYIIKDPGSSVVENYDNLLGTIYYIQDIVMVVSESVLTFFIP